MSWRFAFQNRQIEMLGLLLDPNIVGFDADVLEPEKLFERFINTCRFPDCLVWFGLGPGGLRGGAPDAFEGPTDGPGGVPGASGAPGAILFARSS